MENDGDGFEEGGSDGPAAAEDFDGVIVGAAAAELEGEMEIAEGWERRGREFGAIFLKGDLPETGAGRGGVAAARIEVVEVGSNEGRREAMAELLFIIGRMPRSSVWESTGRPISLPIFPPRRDPARRQNRKSFPL